MPVEAKPLFRPDVLRPHLQAFKLPENLDATRETFGRWAKLLASRKADKLKEKELLPVFLSEIFGQALGYSGPADDSERYTMSLEQHVQVAGEYADAALGIFGPDQKRFIVAVEGKGPTDPLDRPYSGRRISAVQQALNYAVNLPCEWYVVTSMRQTRLYFKGADQYTFERFDTERLASDDAQLKRFLYLLGAERVVPQSGECHLFELFKASETAGKKLTKEFYVEYTEMRQSAFDHLCRENPKVTPDSLLTATQKLLDRILFCAFCEDRGLLPSDTIKKAYEHRGYVERPIWDNFRDLFRAIDVGNDGLKIPAYNGGLFARDPGLDDLKLTNEICDYFRHLAEYDYRQPSAVSAEEDEAKGKLVDVDILGHIFEQSITDLEQLRNELDGLVEPVAREKHTSRRKKEGAFYTPAFITRYIVEQALGSVLSDRFEALRTAHEAKAKGTAKTALTDPTVYDLDELKAPQKKALITFWEAWQDELKTVKVLDPACGSGSMLIEAFDQLHMVYQTSNDRLEELRGARSLFDPDRQILQHNLYGVDINEEAVEICKLSLWIKTAARGKALTSLDETIQVGNSVVSDTAVHLRAFDWQESFPRVFKKGGFDVVVGNPPYVRQEWLGDIKPFLQENYQTYHGMADLYVYFYELGVRVLKPGGRLSFVVTNKWMKAGYGEPLRRFFSEHAWMESVIDFGHAKQIFEDADVFPSIIVLRKPCDEAQRPTARACVISRETLRVDDLGQQIRNEGFEVPASQLGVVGWQLEPKEVNELLDRMGIVGVPLEQFANISPLRGILTGLNEAFMMDGATKAALIAADPRSSELLRPYLRGQDNDRWQANWEGLWMLAMKSSSDHTWPWSDSGESAEMKFKSAYPAIHAHLNAFKPQLIARQDKGRFWWELRSCAYWDAFNKPKIMYPEITWRAEWSLDTEGTLSNNTVYILPCDDLWILAVANAPITWWYSWRKALHGKDEALRFIKDYAKTIPVPVPTPAQQDAANIAVRRLIEINKSRHGVVQTLLDWLKVEYEIEKPSKKLQDPITLNSDSLVAEVKKLRGKAKPLTAAALKALRDEDSHTLGPARVQAAEALKLEHELSDLVNAAYSLTPTEVQLMWDTAPPRMPIGPAHKN